MRLTISPPHGWHEMSRRRLKKPCNTPGKSKSRSSARRVRPKSRNRQLIAQVSQLEESKVKQRPEEAEHEQVESQLRSRERYLALLNDMTRAILLSDDFDSTLTTLAFDMAKLNEADDCYITRWDNEKQLTIPTTTTAKLETPYSTQITSGNQLTF